jgi:hypothetical protein
MGQQQLILLVIGVVVVGIAIMLGFQAFTEGLKKTNLDALINDANAVACDAQIWRAKSLVNGGGGGNPSNDMWHGLAFSKLGYPVEDDGSYLNPNGMFTLVDEGNSVLTITARNPSLGNEVVFTVTGMSPDDIIYVINPNYTGD